MVGRKSSVPNNTGQGSMISNYQVEDWLKNTKNQNNRRKNSEITSINKQLK